MMKKYQRVLKFLFDNRNIEGGWFRASEIAKALNRPKISVRCNLNFFYATRKVDRKRDKNRWLWRINYQGINYLYVKGLITKEEKERAIEDLQLI